jgi:hypothetical protein
VFQCISCLIRKLIDKKGAVNTPTDLAALCLAISFKVHAFAMPEVHGEGIFTPDNNLSGRVVDGR